jgi:hypothetical protein
MKSYVETREGWWLNLKRMVILAAFVLSIILTLMILIPAYIFGYIVVPELCLSTDICLLTMLVFIVMFIMSLIWSVIYTDKEQLRIYRGEKGYFDGILSSIEDSLKESGIQYNRIDVPSRGKHQQFKLIDYECLLNVIDNSKKIKPEAVQISFLPVTRNNQREIDSLKTIIEDIMKKRNFTVYREYEDLVQYYDSF